MGVGTLPLPAGAHVVGWASSYDALIVFPDLIELSELTQLPPLLVTHGVDGNTLRTGLVYRPEYDRVPRFPIGQYLARERSLLSNSDIDYVEDTIYALVNAMDRLEIGSRYRLSRYFPGLRQEFLGALVLAKKIDRLLENLRESVIVVTHFNGLEERILEQVAGRHGIRLYARPHGWLANPEGYEYEAERYWVPGELQAQFLRRFFGYGDRVEVVPDANLTRAANEWLNVPSVDQRVLTENRRSERNIRQRLVVALLTTASRNRMLSDFDSDALHAEWLEILGLLKQRPELHAVVKSHPSFNYDPWLQGLARERGVSNLTIANERLEETLTYVDLVVNMGYLSTAVLATLMQRKPLLLYRGLCRYHRPFGDLVYAEGAKSVVQGPEALAVEWDHLQAGGLKYLRDVEQRNERLRRVLC